MGKVYDDVEVIGVVQPADATRAVASYATISGATITAPAIGADPTQTDALEYLEVTYGARLSKATGGTGTLGISVGGAAPAAYTERVVSQAVAAGAQGVGGTFLIARTTGAAVVVALQAKSSDTDILTIDDPYLSVKRIRTPGGIG